MIIQSRRLFTVRLWIKMIIVIFQTLKSFRSMRDPRTDRSYWFMLLTLYCYHVQIEFQNFVFRLDGNGTVSKLTSELKCGFYFRKSDFQFMFIYHNIKTKWPQAMISLRLSKDSLQVYIEIPHDGHHKTWHNSPAQTVADDVYWKISISALNCYFTAIIL